MSEWLALVGFFLAGLLSLWIAGFMFWLTITESVGQVSFGLSGLLMLVLAVGFFIAVKFFRKEIALNPIRQYLKDPTGFEFIQGEMISSYYSSGGQKGSRKIVVEIKAKGKNADTIEHFSPSVWPFTTKEADASLGKDDDWYDMKGKRPYLPVKVHLLYHPKFSSALVGIDQHLLKKA